MLLLLPHTAKAQQEEVLLTFHHPAIGSIYVGSLYDSKSDAMFLPLIELFSLLEINYQSNTKNFTVQGNYIKPNTPYVINFSTGQVQLGKNMFFLRREDFRIGATDFYLSPKIFEEVFGLKFTVEMAPLVLTLETTQKLPIQERKARELARSRIEGQELNQANYPLEYDRKRSILSGSMLDYAITGDYTKEAQSMNYTLTGGMEILGGDIQGTVNGLNSTTGTHSFNANGVRWRYAIRDNNLLSGIILGQTNTTSLEPLAIRGFALTNDPIEPRQMYDTYMIDGNTEPNSEVELYVNEQLQSFKRADEVGYYRFDVPITYGTTRLSLHIYTPSGQLIVTDRQMQVPFTFLPRGIISYNIQAGKTENFLSDSIQGRWVAHANIAMGLTNWLTASVGTQFIDKTTNSEGRMYYSNLSARIAKQYLISIDAAPQNYYRFTGSVLYANNLNFNFIYTKFDGQSVFNLRKATDDINANIYLPFNIFGINTGLRMSAEHLILPERTQTIYSSDLSARLGKVNLRWNYRDNFETTNSTTAFGQGLLTTALTYTIARMPGIPVYVRGMYVRGQTIYDIRRNQLQTSEIELSRTILKSGRLDFTLAYNHISQKINTMLGFTFDLNKVRSTTTLNTYGGTVTARQSLNGSIGWDMSNNAIRFSNRQQVGRCAAAVLLFVDNNNSGHYDAGDQLLPYRAIKLDRTSIMEVGDDSILRLSQLQSYYKYNLSVNRNVIPDPTLVPLKDKFSFITDPNQYKRIEIPFYRGGTIQGVVQIERNGITIGQGGLRLKIKAVDNDYSSIIRTMSDGGFYTMDLAPGKYTIEVDTTQLDFLNACQSGKYNFEIKASSTGDFQEGLNIVLTSLAQDTSSVSKSAQETVLSEKNNIRPNIDSNRNKQNFGITLYLSDTIKLEIPSAASICFPFNSSYLTPSLKAFLDNLASVLKTHSWSMLIIYGNTDSRGTDSYNKWLSLRRANRVKEYLVHQNIPQAKVITVGSGKDKPIFTNATKEGRELNRRIDIQVTK
jgi:Outer membrane protein and related peptidoglycan-associated (lipo)proteins